MRRRAELAGPHHAAIGGGKRNHGAFLEHTDQQIAGGCERRDHRMLERSPPLLRTGFSIERMDFVTRRDIQHAIQQERRPRGLKVAPPDFRARRATQRLQLLRLNRDVDALRVHRAAGRRQRIKRDDPLLFDGKKRERNGPDLLSAR